MTEQLVKRFVKDYKNTEDINVRTAYGVLASIVGICCNLLLFTAKIFLVFINKKNLLITIHVKKEIVFCQKLSIILKFIKESVITVTKH